MIAEPVEELVVVDHRCVDDIGIADHAGAVDAECTSIGPFAPPVDHVAAGSSASGGSGSDSEVAKPPAAMGCTGAAIAS